MRSRLEHRHAGVVTIALSILTLSIGSTLIRKTGSPGPVVAFWRLTIAAAVWHLVAAVRHARPNLSQWRAVLPAGLCFGGDLIFFFSAVQHTRIANAEFTGTLAPVIVVPIAAWRLREKVAPRTLALGCVALTGVALILLTARGGAGSRRGDLLAVCAVVTWAGYLLVTRRVRQVVDTNAFMAVMSTVAAVVVAPFALATHRIASVSGKGWALITVMAIANGIVAHGALAWAQRRVPVSTTSMMQLAQPGVSTLWAFLLLGESVRLVQIAGMAIVLVAVGFIARHTARAPVVPVAETTAAPAR